MKKNRKFDGLFSTLKCKQAIFDCDNTLWFHKQNQPEIMSYNMGIKDADEFAKEFIDMINAFNSRLVNTKVTLKRLYKIIEDTMPILFFNNISPEEFMRLWGGLKFEINDFNSDAIEIMEYLREKNIKIVILSDWWREVQTDLLKKFGVLQYIDKMYCCDNRYLKCNLLSSDGVIIPGKEDEYIMIGDSLYSDIAFANHSGIQSIWLNNKMEENKTDYKPTYEVTSLLEIKQII